MSKKSRQKREDRETRFPQSIPDSERKSLPEGQTPFLVYFIIFAVCLTLFTPLIFNARFYFPFVGPKSLFFMAGAEIIFFAWLILILKHKKYRPKLNTVLIALILFLTVLILSSLFGVDFSRSFWSKYERMTGLLMWFHIFAFFLVISSTFRKVSDWHKIFTASIFVAIITSLMALFEIAGVETFKFSDRAGVTLGNTSFLGTYLLFNVFLAVFLFFQKRNWGWRIYSLIGIILMILAMSLSEAMAATLSTIGGIGLIFLLWLSFKPQRKIIRIFGKIFLIISSLAVLLAVILLFVPDSIVRQIFVKVTTPSRFLNWEMAKTGFLERPLLGWGPENYELVFTKFFNSCLFISECGGEIWFDRTHNIVFDTLSTIGIFGFLTYLGLFVAFFFVLWRKYFKEKLIDFWTFSIFTAIPISYFIQNLTVFDMVSSLMMFGLILGFGGFLANLGREKEIEQKVIPGYRVFGILIFFVFLFTFFEFIIQPVRTDCLVIKALGANNSQERVQLYEKTLKISPTGKYQIREFFGQHSLGIFSGKINEISENEDLKKEVGKELDFLTKELEKSMEEAPLDYRGALRLAHLYNFYSSIDSEKIPLAEKRAEELLELSPTNQQGYWVLAQNKVFQKDFETAFNLAQEAINLEPRHLQSHQIAIQIAKIVGDLDKAKEIAERAIEINPDWQEEFKDILE